MAMMYIFKRLVQPTTPNVPSAYPRVIPTEGLAEDEQRRDVDAETEDLADHHETVPGAHRQRHHQQLREDERRERDGDNVDEVVLKQQQRTVHKDAPYNMVNST